MQSGETLELVGLDEANQVVVTSVYTGAGAKRASISGVFRAAEARTFGNPGIGFSGQWSPTDLGIKFQQCLTATASGGLVACPLAPAVFAVSSRGTGPISHQWQARGGPALEWTDLTDGPNSVASEFLLNAAGAASPTLTVDRSPVGWTTPLEFRCVVSNACGTLTTDAAMLKLAPDMTAGAIPGSPSYGVPNGLVNNDDFFYFLSAFAAGNLALADLTTGAVAGQPGYGTPDGVLNNDDFFYYLNIFAAGC